MYVGMHVLMHGSMRRSSRFARRVLAALAVVTTCAVVVLRPSRAAAQEKAITVSDDARDHRAVVRLGSVLSDRELQDAALGGLPVRVHVRTELWKDGFFDSREAAADWSAVLAYEPLKQRYLVRPVDAAGPARSFPTYDRARAAIEGEIPVRLKPSRQGRYYYTSTLEIETLSVSDLQELERWLQGELQPAVSGDQSIPGAIGAGAKRLLIKVLGVPARRFEARSARFRVPN
jgi:hypothetical protein